MPRLIRSARGEQVNFDLLLIKQEIAANAAPTNVSSRHDFIENRIRRRPKRGVGKTALPSERELGPEITIKDLELDEGIEDEFDETAVPAVELEVAPAAEPTKTARPVKGK